MSTYRVDLSTKRTTAQTETLLSELNGRFIGRHNGISTDIETELPIEQVREVLDGSEIVLYWADSYGYGQPGNPGY